MPLKRPILTPAEWIDDPYYSGPLKRDVWPQKVQDFVACAQGQYNEIIFTGAIGIGKTALVKMVIAYDLYRLSCFEDPQRALGVSQTETLLFVLVSLNQTKAKAKLFKPLRELILRTPYFRDHFMPDSRVASSLDFPNNIRVIPGTTGEGAVHSEDVVCLALSEANFLPVVADSKRKRGGEVYDVAQDLLDATIRRQRTRFQVSGGRLPLCRILIDSSRQYPDDFVERRCLQISQGEVKHPSIVISRSQWEAKAGVLDASGSPLYGGDTFPVEVGTAQRYSRVIPPEDAPFARGKVVQVPVELRPAFDDDIEGALRDYAGIAVLSLRPLMTDRKAVYECIRYEEGGFAKFEVEHPFTSVSTSLKDESRLLIDQLSVVVNGRPQPRINPKAQRTLHVDVGLTGDALGLAIGHVPDTVMISRSQNGEVAGLPCRSCKGEKLVTCPRCGGTGSRVVLGTKVKCRMCNGAKGVACHSCNGTGLYGIPVLRPRVYIDLMLQVTPPPNGQIQFDDVEALIKRLRDDCGFSIPIVTADGYESAQFLQRQVSQYGAVVAERLSMDITKDPYYALRNSVTDIDGSGRRRLSYYSYSPFLTEITKVEDRPAKIDHPHGGSKDVADAMAGVVWNCERFRPLQVTGDLASLNITEF